MFLKHFFKRFLKKVFKKKFEKNSITQNNTKYPKLSNLETANDQTFTSKNNSQCYIFILYTLFFLTNLFISLFIERQNI